MSDNFQQAQPWYRELPDVVETCAHHIFHQKAVEQPGSPAVSSWDGSLTYEELDTLSSVLADQLRPYGVGPEVFVPLFFEKSAWTIVAMLAVCKSGGAFVPLDPGQPNARLEHAVRQIKSNFALASPKHKDKCAKFVKNVMVVDAQSLDRSTTPTSTPVMSPSNSAYIIYTSGSTGQPKAVVIEHKQLCTSSLRGGAAMGFLEKPRMLQFSSYIFDACILEIWTTLMYGGCICIPSEGERFNDLAQAMERLAVTHAFFTPSLLRTLGDTCPATLKTVILGGERLPEDLIDKWSRKVKLILAYGPTECTVICFTLDTGNKQVTPGCLGHPIRGVGRAWLVKQHDHHTLATRDEVGELLFEGPVLSRGYLNDAIKTTDTFVTGMSWTTGRLYRTGDLARYNPDGTMSFMGRRDNQIKVRGQRLELGEVEHQLRRCVEFEPAVIDVVVEVIKPKDKTDAQTLIGILYLAEDVELGFLQWGDDQSARIITSERQQLSFSRLGDAALEGLISVLPQYAAPSLLVPMKRLPLSVSGKIDRRSLRAIVERFTTVELNSFRAPTLRTSAIPSRPMELQLQSLWAETLSLKPQDIKLQDNFLWYGDSILAIHLVGRARSKGLFLTVSAIFENPIFADMAGQLVKNAKDADSVVPFQLVKSKDEILNLVKTQYDLDSELVTDIYPASPMQQALMALSISQPGAYVMKFVCEVSPAVHLDRLEAAWLIVVKETPILSTRMVQDASGNLLQVVMRDSPVWTVVNTALDSLLSETTSVGFGQPMTHLTVSVHDGKTHLVWIVHHCVLDGWSLPRITKQVERAYLGQPLAQAPGFNAFLHYLSTIDSHEALNFWATKLEDASAPTFPWLPTLDYRGLANSSQELEICITRTAQSSITTATLLQAAWALLIASYSGATDVVTAVTFNGRMAPIPGIEQIIGPTIVTLPIRTRFSRDQYIMDLLQTVQDEYVKTVPHQQFGLQNIGHISPEIKAICDFRSLLVIQSTESSERSELLSELQNVSYYLPYPLTMECTLQNRSVQVRAIFDDRVLDFQQIQSILEQFAHLLTNLALEESTTRVADVLGVCEVGRNKILEWNAHQPAAVEDCLHSLVRKRIESQPHATAVCSWDGELTYSVLGQYSTTLATHLIQQYGVKPGIVVPVCLDKSKWAVVAMLAILQAGGAYVCLAPSHPPSRLEAIIRQCGSQFVVTSNAHQGVFAEMDVRTVELSLDLIERSKSDQELAQTVRPSDAALIVFTSGSTGTPKGIVIEHRAMCTSVIEHGRFIQLDENSRVLQFAAYTFDISYSDIFATLTYGGCVCIASEYDRMNNLAGTIQDMNVNHASLTNSIAAHLDPTDVPCLRTLVQAGEALTRDIIEKWSTSVWLIDMYGPAECTIYCIGNRQVDRAGTIGKGIGAIVWIVDQHDPNVLAPIGGVGEICIEGPLLARCYLNDPEKTQSSFVKAPAWMPASRASQSVYRTGDLARYDTDGSIIFLGRADGQIKLRGQRIELGEVEHHLSKVILPRTQIAVEIVQLNEAQALAAFIVVEPDAGHGDLLAKSDKKLRSIVSEVTEQLSASLPLYMIPTVYLPLQRLPLLSSGKVDRKQLQHLVSDTPKGRMLFLNSSKHTARQPATDLERQMQTLWQEVFEQGSNSAEDNFFYCGGDSIVAMKLVAAARKANLLLTVLIIEPFSLLPADHLPETLTAAMVQCNLKRDEIEDFFPAASMQLRFLEVRSPTQFVFDMPRSIPLEKFTSAWNAAAVRHGLLRSRLIRSPIGPLQVVAKGDLHWDYRTNLEEYLIRDARNPLALGATLCRFCVVEDGSSHGRFFVWTASHAMYDGTSLPLLLQDVESAYHKGVVNPSELTFKEFIRKTSAENVGRAELYWKFQLAIAKDIDLARPFWNVHESYTPVANTMVSRNVKAATTSRSGITTSTLIEVALALAIAQQQDAEGVVFAINRTGRNIPLRGIQDLAAPVLARPPHLIRFDPEREVRTLLRDVQKGLYEMSWCEHYNWDRIESINESTAAACAAAIQIGITPASTIEFDHLGGTIGDLRLLWTGFTSHVPFRFDIVYEANGLINAAAVYDGDLVSYDVVDSILRRFEHAIYIFGQNRDRKVEDIHLRQTWGVPSTLTTVEVAPFSIQKFVGNQRTCI